MARRSNLELPADLVTEILLKLPVKSIIRFQCVAKTWYHLFKNPSFVSQHLRLSKKNSQSLIVYYVGDDYYNKIGMLSFPDDQDQTIVSCNDLHQRLPSDLADKEYLFLQVSDGLVCFYDAMDCGITIWNPATKQFRILPDCNQYIRLKGAFILPYLACGMDPLSNDYKLLYYTHYRSTHEFKTQCAIYKMSNDSWRVLEDEDVKILKGLDSIQRNKSNACVNGVCYWKAYPSGSQRIKVLTFNLSTEVFRLLRSPIPAEPSGNLIPLHDGRITFWDYSSIMTPRTGPCAVWVLNDDESWTKLFNFHSLPDVCTPYGFWTHGKVFVAYGDRRKDLLLYDLETREFSEPGFVASFAWVYTYEESLIAVHRE